MKKADKKRTQMPNAAQKSESSTANPGNKSQQGIKEVKRNAGVKSDSTVTKKLRSETGTIVVVRRNQKQEDMDSVEENSDSQEGNIRDQHDSYGAQNIQEVKAIPYIVNLLCLPFFVFVTANVYLPKATLFFCNAFSFYACCIFIFGYYIFSFHYCNFSFL